MGGTPPAGESDASAPVAHVRLKGYVSAGLSREDWDADLGTVPVSERVALQYPGLYALMVSGDSLESQGIHSDDLLFLTRIPHLAQTSDAVNRQLSCFSSRYMNLLAVFQI